jgi:hypothetical protein
VLAIAKSGDDLAAIGALETLIKLAGDTADREGMIGGCYKRLKRGAVDPGDQKRYLNKAIEHYERGMTLDLNAYYSSCNLPALYRERRRMGDLARAREAATAARLACERARKLGIADKWLLPTLLVVAFFEGDLRVIEDFCQEIENEGGDHSAWRLTTTILDLEAIAAQTEDEEVRAALLPAVEGLRALLPRTEEP